MSNKRRTSSEQPALPFPESGTEPKSLKESPASPPSPPSPIVSTPAPLPPVSLPRRIIVHLAHRIYGARIRSECGAYIAEGDSTVELFADHPSKKLTFDHRKVTCKLCLRSFNRIPRIPKP